MKDTYEKFAKDYDEFGLLDWSIDEKQFFENLFIENNVHIVLDCACGTGQTCSCFRKRVFVCGF